MDRKYNIEKLPKRYRSDVRKAINILVKEGCKEIFLFGSLVNGESTDRSDIDLAVTGIRKEDFFEIFGELMMSLDHPVDLINLEKKSRFMAYLKEKGELVRVA
jgi:predicted nucleotidyltransferase